jgi:hypothetical protein
MLLLNEELQDAMYMYCGQIESLELDISWKLGLQPLTLPLLSQISNSLPK